jgi:hypothetical protein
VLKVRTVEYNDYILRLDEDGEPDILSDESYIEQEDYCCPICGKTLFTFEEEAVEFLRGGESA